jgi:hypothetical protein
VARARKPLASGAVIVALAWSPLLLGAQPASAPCDPSLPSIDLAIGYRARDDDKRCEGGYRSPVSASGLVGFGELVSRGCWQSVAGSIS